MVEFLASEDELASRIAGGAKLALPPDYSGCAMSTVRELVCRGVRELHLVATPQLGLQADLLIGAGCVQTVETAAVTLGELGPAPRFVHAVKTGAIELLDSTCPAIHAGLQAAEKGIPFMPLRGIIGSDLLSTRDDWQVLDNPYAENDPIVVLPAIRPDVALFHARLADLDGNVWIGVRRELMLLAHAARTTLVTCEHLSGDNLLQDERYAAGTIPSLYISALCEAPRGAYPLALAGSYDADIEHLQAYAELARSDAGFERYLEMHVLGVSA